MKIFSIVIFGLILSPICYSQNVNAIKGLADEEKDKFMSLLKKSSQVYMFSNENQIILDSIIKLLPDDPFYYQQKSMLLFKQRKYELGMTYLENAIYLKGGEEFLPNRAFIKCIFQKDFAGSIKDFQTLINQNPEGTTMDHFYDFYLGLNYLQLNEFEIAKNYFLESENKSLRILGQKNLYNTFYIGIVEYELKNYTEAIEVFDSVLEEYRQFSEAKFYKSLSLYYMGNIDLASKLLENSYEDFKTGYSINESNVIYENFPYQLKEFNFEVVRRLFEKN